MSPIIQTVNLTKKFLRPKSYFQILRHPFRKDEITALENVNITVSKGELFGLLGPNGAGKTTLIKLLCGLIVPTEGNAFISGFDTAKHERQIHELIGYVVSEERSFYWRLTGRQNLRFFATLNNIFGRAAEKRIQELAELIGLNEDIDKTFQNYPSGMKQKLAIARGMLTDPPILLLDEPTRNLDPIATYKLRGFVRNVIVGEEKKTVIVATNNMQEADELCDQVAILDRGKLKLSGPVRDIKRMIEDKERYVLKIRGAFGQIKQKLSHLRLDGNVTRCIPEPLPETGALLTIEIDGKKETISRIIEQIVMSGMKLQTCTRDELSLNDLFSRIIEQ